MIEKVYIFFLKKPFLITIIFLLVSTILISIINNIVIYDDHRYSDNLDKLIAKDKILDEDLIAEKYLLETQNPTLKNKNLIVKFFNKSKIKEGECVFFNFWVKKNKNFTSKMTFFPAIWTNRKNFNDIKSYLKITRDMITVNTTKKNEQFTGLSFDEGIINVPISILNSQNWHMITFMVTKKSVFRPREMFLFLDSNLIGNSYINKNLNFFTDLSFLNTIYEENYPNTAILMAKSLYSDYCFSQQEIRHLYNFDISRSFNDL